MHNPFVRVGVNIILLQNDKVLLGLRKGKAGNKTWGVPGGHLEHMELVTEGVKRELLEETGLVADEIEFVGVNNQPRPATNEHYIQINFVSNKFHGDLELKEPESCERWSWFDINNLPNPMFDAHKDFIQDYLARRLLRDEAL